MHGDWRVFCVRLVPFDRPRGHTVTGLTLPEAKSGIPHGVRTQAEHHRQMNLVRETFTVLANEAVVRHWMRMGLW